MAAKGDLQGMVIARAGPRKTGAGFFTTVTLRDLERQTTNLTIWTSSDSEARALEHLCRVGNVLNVVRASVLTKTNGYPETLDPLTSSTVKLKFVPRSEFQKLKTLN